MDVWTFDEISSTLMIRTPSNKMEGVFKLYAPEDSDLDTSLTVAVREENSLTASISVRTSGRSDLNAFIDVKYRENDDIGTFIEIMGGSYLETFLEVRPNNRMFGIFEILPAPRAVKEIISTEDSTTRSRPDLMTINYGDSQRMMVGNATVDSNTVENLESFIRFGNINDYIQDLAILERANLRLYYTGDFVDDVELSLHLPNEKWSEMGITYANKPKHGRFITDNYTINKVDRYIEFDIKDLVQQWIDGAELNLGLIISSSSDVATSFYTREGRFPPIIDLQYVTNQVVSIGRTELDATMFIYGVGHGDLNTTLTVHSDYGFDWLESTLYVHRPEVPMPDDLNINVAASRPDQPVKLSVALRDNEEIQAQVSVQRREVNELESKLGVSKPDLHVGLTVDPNISLAATLAVKGIYNDDQDATFAVTKDSMNTTLFVRAYGESSMNATLVVQNNEYEDMDSTFTVSKPDQAVTLYVRAYGEDDLQSIVEVPYYDNMDATLAVTKGDLAAYLDVRTPYDVESTLFVKYQDTLDVSLTVNNISELEVMLEVRAISDADSTVTVSKPDLNVFLYPRVAGEHDTEIFALIRQRDADDLNVYFFVGGSYGAYYFII